MDLILPADEHWDEKLLYQRPKKYSLTLQGHQTSVSLEPAFWEEFRKLAGEKHQSLAGLISKIDAQRGAQCGLAGAIRLYVLAELIARRPGAAMEGNQS